MTNFLYNDKIIANENYSQLEFEVFNMKKIIFIILTLFIFSGCSHTYEDNSKPTVYTSFYGMYDFARTIAGEKATIINLLPTGVDAHDWEPGTHDIIGLNKADVFIYSGMGMEHWTEDIIKSLDNKDIVLIEASSGITPISGKNNTDPHVWLNPQNAIKELSNICEGLCLADKENAEHYLNNFYNIKEKIEALDSDFKTFTALLPEKEIIVTHGAFSYLCDAYGLYQYSIEGISGEGDPSSASVREVIDYMKENNKKAIFYIKSESSELAEVIAAETGARIFQLNPFESDIDGKSYIDVMKENMNSIKDAFLIDE